MDLRTAHGRLLAVSLVILSVSPVLASNTYHVTDLGFLPAGADATGDGLNDSGLVVGGASNSAFKYTGTTPIVALSGSGSPSEAHAINNAGLIVGSMTVGSTLHAFSSSGTGLTDLVGTPGSFGDAYSIAYGVNTSGTIVGQAQNSAGALRSFVDTGSGISFLSGENGSTTGLGGGPTLGATVVQSTAYGINASGQIVGQADLDTGGVSHAYLYSAGTFHDLGALAGDTTSSAFGINTAGLIVGNSGLSAAKFSATGSPTALPTLAGADSSIANAVNDAGLIVGQTTIGTVNVATLYDSSGAHDLKTLIAGDPLYNAVSFTNAVSINGSNWIVANGSLNSDPGTPRTFLLTIVPEPSVITLMAVLAGGALLRRRRRAY